MNKKSRSKRKRNTYLLVLAVILFVLISIQLINDGKKVEVSSVKWNRENGNYLVKFTVENKARHDLPANVSIRATRSRKIGKGQVFDLVGEKIVKVTLKSGESRKIKELLNLKFPGRVDNIIVNAWEPNKPVPNTYMAFLCQGKRSPVDRKNDFLRLDDDIFSKGSVADFGFHNTVSDHISCLYQTPIEIIPIGY